MDQDQKNLLTIKPYYLIRSKRTKRPYIDMNRACYMFETNSDATTFAQESEDTYVEEAKTYRQAVFATEFYSYGIRKIKVKGRKDETFIEIPIEPTDIHRQFYNEEVNHLLYRLKQTGKKEYLLALKNGQILIPTLIEARAKKFMPKIHYCYAEGQSGPLYICFSTIQEFEKWNKTQGDKWAPLAVRFSDIDKIKKGCTICINPMDDKIIISSRQMQMMLKG